jgi:copper chaperone CopZ
MKKLLTILALAVAANLGAYAADVTLSDVHLCCGSCVKGVSAAVSKVDGVTAEADQDAGTVKLTAADVATLQKAADALVAAGYFGKSSDPAVKINAETGAKNVKVQSLTIEGLHMCCGKCVKAVNKILADVPGVTGNTAAKGVKTFTVTGDFNDKDVFDAFQKAGLTGIEKPSAN